MNDPHYQPAMASTTMYPAVAAASSLSFSRPSGGDIASFNSSFNSSLSPAHHSANPYSHAPTHSMNSLQHSSSSFRQSFEETEPRRPATSGDGPQIYTAVYSSVPVYEMEVRGVAVMRRRADSWLNATQILKVAGVEKGRRTKILEKEILTGQYEKIQGGYGRYQGTWINYQRGRQFCRDYGVEDALRPLLDYDISSDGTGNSAYNDTPTKEQAMAANRRKFFTSSMDGKVNQNQGSRNTFFQNIGPAASTALAAMNKAARYDTTLARPSSAQRKTPGIIRRQSSQQGVFSQESSYLGGSQQSNHSFISDQMGMESNHDAGHGNMSGGPQVRTSDARMGEQEPPRKKMRTSFEADPYLDPNLQDDNRTELAESFSQSHQSNSGRDMVPGNSLPPLPTPEDKDGLEKQRVLLDLFADPSQSDFSNHPALVHLSGQDLDIPVDQKANTALHWAALLGKVNVVKGLVNNGANIFRGNAGGETPLMQAVSVNNTYEHNSFSEMLDYLGPLIEVRDAQGRTVLHHIAVASGIKGRMQSSRYYLESLLEFVVRNGSFNAGNGLHTPFGDNKNTARSSKPKAVNLVRFMSDVVNIQDKSGNTALNLVSRIGSHAIINQLEEIGADFTIANHKGFRPESFGIFPKSIGSGGVGSNLASQQQQSIPQGQGQGDSQGNGSSQELTQSDGEVKASLSQIEQMREEIVTSKCIVLLRHSGLFVSAQNGWDLDVPLPRQASTSGFRFHLQPHFQQDHRLTLTPSKTATQSILTRTQANHQAERSRLDATLSTQSADLRALATQHTGLVAQVTALKAAAKSRRDNATKLTNLNHLTGEFRKRSNYPVGDGSQKEKKISDLEIDPALLTSTNTNDAPSTPHLRSLLSAHEQHNTSLTSTLQKLKSLQSDELEAMYRRVVSLCTNVPEEEVEDVLPALVGALESGGI